MTMAEAHPSYSEEALGFESPALSDTHASCTRPAAVVHEPSVVLTLIEQVRRAHASTLALHGQLLDQMIAELPQAHTVPVSYPPQRRPLANSPCRRLSASDLAALSEGRAEEVLQVTHAMAPRLPTVWLCYEVDIDPSGGTYGLGLLTASLIGPGDLAEEVDQLLRIYALHQGLHRVLPPSQFRRLPSSVSAGLTVDGRCTVEVSALGLVPRPYLRAEVQLPGGGRAEFGVELREEPGQDVVRQGVACNEFHIAHGAEGDLDIVFGRGVVSRATVRPRLPRREFLMVDRLLECTASPGAIAPGMVAVTEYDVPAEPWYRTENSGALPLLFLVESALQGSAFCALQSGAYLEYPDQNFRCRNLDGKLRLLADLDPTGRTLTHRSVLLSHTTTPGMVMQRYSFEVDVDGVAFYAGETVHGFFTDDQLFGRQDTPGDRQPEVVGAPGEVVCVTPAELAALPGPGLGHGRFTLLDYVDVAATGGEHRRGYAVGCQRIDAGNWFFSQHFLHDPVMPGSVGLEGLYQTLRAYLIATGLGRSFTGAHLPVGVDCEWKYRGQILPGDHRVRYVITVRELTHGADHLRVQADGQVWCDGERIYTVTGVCLELR
jgi:3-hydroxymyristoyl/3-hydroxydecanoyl-(acyl carrier protein) dehydratase